MIDLRSTIVHAWLLLALAWSAASACDVCNPGSTETPMPGGWSLSVFRPDGTPASQPAAADGVSASGKEVGLGGGATDPNQPARLQILYIRTSFADDTREWISKDDAYQDCRGVADYFAENSYGALQVSFDVTPLLRLPRSYLHYKEVIPHPGLMGSGPMVADAVVAARAAGYNLGNYSVVAVAHRSMFGASSSNIQVENKGWAVLAHELGHVLGAGHSVSWQADGTSAHGARDWRRFGLGTVTTLYNEQVQIYSDPWCLMGGGDGHYALYWKLASSWLPRAQVPEITRSGRYRITAFDYPTLDPSRTYGFTIRRNSEQIYYAGYRVRQVDGRPARFQLPVETWLPDSLLLWGGPWDGSREPNTPPNPQPYLIDTTPGSPSSLTAAVGTAAPIDGGNLKDSGIQVGRTWSDPAAGIHITVVNRVRSEPEALDVVVNLGSFPGNRKPTVTLTATGGTPSATGQYMVTHVPGFPSSSVGFQAVAADPDGDELAYFWDFGDVTNSSLNQANITHAWSDAVVGSGRLLTVRVVVSDMKGGVASAIMPINIGLSEFPALDPSDAVNRQVLWAQGRIVDQAGEPVEGMRVTWIGTPWRGSYTDSDGRYWLGNLSSNAHVFEARSESMYTVGVHDAAPLPSPINFMRRDLDQVDFVAYRRQTVAVAASTPTVAPAATAQFTLTRSFATPGTFSRPASYTLADLTALPAPQLLHARLYPSGGSNWQWRVPPSGTWTALPSFHNILLQTPEDNRQDRRETGVNTNPPNPNALPQDDYYVAFPAGAHVIEVRCNVGIDVPDWQRQVSLMVAHSPDYYVEINQAAVIVANPSPAATPTVTLSVSPASITEGSSEAIQVRISTDVPSPTRLTVPLSLVASPEIRARFGPLPASLVIEPGGMSAACSLHGVDDTLVQGTESATVSIAAGAGYSLGASSLAVSISDNDRQRVWITNTANPARESNGAGGITTGAFMVHRSGSLANALVVQLAAAGTATRGTDYTMPLSVTIPAGLASAEVTLTPLVDATAEGDETAIVSIVQTNDVRVVNPGTATCVIQDAELPNVTISGGGTIAEGGTRNLTISRTGSTASSLTVLFELSGTASYASNDYSIPQMSTYGRVTIPVGQASLVVQIVAGDDNVREITSEDQEYVFIQLTRSGFYNLYPGQDQATVTITDNDSSGLAEVAMEVPTYTVREGENFLIDIVWSDWPTEPSDLGNPVPSLFAAVDYEIVTDDRPSAANPAVAGVHFTSVPATSVSVQRVQANANRLRRIQVNPGTIHDGVYGPDRTFLIRLKNPRNCVLPQIRSGSDNLALCVVTIQDIDSGVVSVAAPVPTAVAGTPGVPGQLRVSRTINAGAPNGPLDVTLELSGNAVAGIDYVPFGVDAGNQGYGGDMTMLRRVTIPAGALFLDVPVTPLDATTERLTRDLDVRVAAAPGYGYNAGLYATVDIVNSALDTRPYVSIAATQAVAYESVAAGANTLRFTVTRTGPTGTSLTVPIVLSGNGNAVAADFATVPASVTIPAGSASVLVSLVAVNDLALEGTETAVVALVSNSSASFRIGGSGAATGWVIDSSLPLPRIAIDTLAAEVLEEDDILAGGSGAVGRLRVRRDSEQSYPLTVTLAISGTATNGTDYAAIPAAVTIPAGAEYVDIEIATLQDALAEGDETVQIAVATGSGYVAKTGFSTGVVTIIDDEAASVGIAWLSDGSEGGGPVEFRLTRSSSDISAVLTVGVALSGAADPLVDLAAASATVQATFPAGAATTVLSLAVVDDALPEADESVIAAVQAGPGCFPAAAATAASVIRDNDQPRIAVALASLVADPDLAYENVAGAPVPRLIRFSRTTTSGALTVRYSVGGTAVSGADYVSLDGVVVFPAGVATIDVTLTPFDDVLVEEPESVVITVDAGAGYNIDPAAGTVALSIISDDEIRVGVMGAANYRHITTFGGPLTFRFYRLGSTIGSLRVNYAMGGTVVEGTDYAFLDGFIDIPDGADHVDLVVPLISAYDATTRRSITCTVDSPVLVGSYVPGSVPGIAGGLLSATTQVLRTGDNALVRLTALYPNAVEGSPTPAVLSFEANAGLAAAQPVDVTVIPGITTALPGAAPAGDYRIHTLPATLPAGDTSVTADLFAEADYLAAETREYVLLALNQPTGVGPADPAYWSVGLPALFWITNALPPQPNIELHLATAGGDLVGLMDPLGGTQKVGEPFIRRYVVVNSGALDLEVTDVSIDTISGAAVSIVGVTPPTTAVLASGGSMVVDISIEPSVFAAWSFRLAIVSNDPDTDPLAVTVYGFGADRTTSGSETGGGMRGTGEGGACGAGGMAGLIVGLGLLLLGVRRAARRRAA